MKLFFIEQQALLLTLLARPSGHTYVPFGQNAHEGIS
jgi:hypothetical protein